MDIFASLLHGFATAITPINLLWAFVGCVLGTAVGVLPGIGPWWPWPCCCPSRQGGHHRVHDRAGIYYGAM
jgi:putative tricarboxylic transport membrane protein